MIENLIRAIIGAIILYLLWLVVGWLASAMALPPIFMTLIGIIFILIFIIWLIRVFGIIL